MTDQQHSAIAGFFDGLKPEARISADEWAESHRYLSALAAAEPGKYKLTRTPYLRDILKALSAMDSCERVVFMKAAQVGATEAGLCWIGYLIDISPCPTLMVMPTDETMKRNSKIRFDPMIRSTPRLKAKVAPSKSRDTENTMMQKHFPNGVIVMTGANSAVALRSLPMRCIFLDEVDGYPKDLDDEGGPIELAEARTRTFSRRKIFITSTPKLSGQSTIQKEFEETDQQHYFVPCPDCGAEQHLQFGQFRWTEGRPDTVLYECEHCHSLMPERKKTEMMARGVWRATCKRNISAEKKGFHINSLYSPLGWYSWSNCIRDYEKALKDKDGKKMKTFTNTVLGLPYEEGVGEKPDWEILYSRREDYVQNTVSDSVYFITAGADVQGDRIEVEIVGWGKGKVSRSIDYRVLIGDTAKKEVWDQLAAIMDEEWIRPDCRELKIRCMAVDSGHNTSHVYAFCERFTGTRVIPVKGADKQAVPVSTPRPINVMRNGKKVKSGSSLWLVAVSMLKQELYSWLRLQNTGSEVPYGFCHFPEYPETYFRGLTAEEVQVRVVNGYNVHYWVKKYARNEPLDCRVYARAASIILGIDRFKPHHYEEMLPAPSPKKPDNKQDRNRHEGGDDYFSRWR